MNEDKERTSKDRKEHRFTLGNIFYHNTFVLIFSLCVTLVTWFVMVSGSSGNRATTLYNVPITVKTSEAAEADGLRVFNMSYTSADLELTGSSLITSKLTAEDFDVYVTLSPASTKLTGNTMQKMTVPVKAVKASAVSDYSISSINPTEVNIEFDRYKETSFPIENEVKYSAEAGYYAGTAVFTEETVVVAGPESSVNKISRAAVVYSAENPLREDETLTCPVRLYDQNDQEITDTSGMYLSLSVDSIGVTIPILPKKTVSLVANTVHMPKGFSNSRITVEPAQIDIAGAQETLSGITEIQLGNVIDFAELNVNEKNVFTVDIPLPAGVRDISVGGDNQVSQATVTVNLNGYESTTVTVPQENIQLTNVPSALLAENMNLSLEVTVAGPEAQVMKLTGDSLSVQADLTNYEERTGMVDVPVTVTVSGSGGDSCWALGRYTTTLSLTPKSEIQTDAEPVSSQGDVAKPQE